MDEETTAGKEDASNIDEDIDVHQGNQSKGVGYSSS